jgi:SAM-dependent methyltransferase
VNRLRHRTNMAERREEFWRPPLHERPAHGVSRIFTAVRRFLDLQTASIWADASAELPAIRGTALDVGCGAQPFRGLFDPAVRYIGIDTIDAKPRFGYETPDTLYYDGDTWPVEDSSVDFVLCTETIEHVSDTVGFLSRISRCLVPGGRLFLTVPFAARWHFIPHDYWRFTPSSLKQLLTASGFRNIGIFARGNEVTVACYKLIALLLPLLLPQNKKPFTTLALRSAAAPFLPFLLLLAAIANLSLHGAGGDDCLGYTVIAEKHCISQDEADEHS